MKVILFSLGTRGDVELAIGCILKARGGDVVCSLPAQLELYRIQSRSQPQRHAHQKAERKEY